MSVHTLIPAVFVSAARFQRQSINPGHGVNKQEFRGGGGAATQDIGRSFRVHLLHTR